MKTRCLLLVALCLQLFSLTTKADGLQVVSSPVDGCFTIAGSVSTDKAIVLYDANDGEVVTTVVDCLLSDLKAVTKKTFMKYKAEPTTLKCPIIVGTIGRSSHIDRLIAEGKIDVSDVEGHWEAYGLQVIDNPMEGVERALVIFGSQPRSTAYGMFELSKMMGVSPWIWWADVKPTVKTKLYVTPGKTIVGTPSVKFRGIFVNDEDWGLRPWGARNLDTDLGNFGPKTYAVIMELMLRLRANTLWPAMHPGSRAFWYEKTNIPLITKYDIYMGSSHCEQMLCNNEYEWERFGGHRDEDWVWHSNKDMIMRYWGARISESKDKNGIYTLGMRAVHDAAMNGYKTTEERVAALTDIIAHQRQLIADSIGDPTTIPQIFIPYKEVLDCYNAGLQIPEDVTLMWVDDNHGYIRQMPTPEEQARSGGNAIYYHLSYWGTPAGYLWLSTISPSLCSYELSKAYSQGMRNQWIINVGDIKPAEEELEFCMDLAWDINSWPPDHAHLYTRNWAARTFGEEFADEISEIKRIYYRLGIAAKPEHVHLCYFDHSNAQLDARIQEYQYIYNKVVALRNRIPDHLQDAYYELIEYPVRGCADQNIKILRGRQSFVYAWAGQRGKALSYSTAAQTAFDEIVTMTEKFNTGIADGKWNYMMSYKPNNMSQHLMPNVATEADVSDIQSTIVQPDITILPGGSYSSASNNVVSLTGLGLAGSTATVWPLDLTAYTSCSQAPYAEYSVPVQEGLNVIQVRCLPTFPINTTYDLRVGISVDGKTPSVLSVKTTAMTTPWDETVVQGYMRAAVHYTSTKDQTVPVRIYFMDPGATVCALASIPFGSDAQDLTTNLLTNADFEYNASGALNPQGNIGRGVPKGWTATGKMKGNSWGINQDAKQIYGINTYWATSTPMPEAYELSQTIPASKLKPGTYLVSCLLGVLKDKLGTCRLFANDVVQYYGKESDYVSSVFTSGETRTFACYVGSGDGRMILKPMEVIVTINEGEDLKLGIRTSNRRGDGSLVTGNNHGCFKVDHFRIQRIDAEDPTGIENKINRDNGNYRGDETYDLAGRKVTNGNLPSGIYIKDGKKKLLKR